MPKARNLGVARVSRVAEPNQDPSLPIRRRGRAERKKPWLEFALFVVKCTILLCRNGFAAFGMVLGFVLGAPLHGSDTRATPRLRALLAPLHGIPVLRKETSLQCY